MNLQNEQRFYSALKEIFIGEKVEGKSGYANLMKIKNQYFEKIKPHLEKKINALVKNPKEREELFEKLYTFFESYISETGTVFFNNTPIHKNLYERVYSDREDVSLFWKTQKLYYVKSEANYKSLTIPIEGYEWRFQFDVSGLEHQKNNEKKSLEFYLAAPPSGAHEKVLVFKVRYKQDNKYDRLKKYLKIDKPDKIRKYLAENLLTLKHPQITVSTNGFDLSKFVPKEIEDTLIIDENNDAVQSVRIEFAINGVDNLLKYFSHAKIFLRADEINRAFFTYRKQNEIDYFIHKDAESFLKEQFDLWLYDFFLKKNVDTLFDDIRLKQVQNIKKIAHDVIAYIARFEDELKFIWNKPKFVRNSNYVFTLDRIENNSGLLKKILSHPGFAKQLDEYDELQKVWLNSAGKVTKKVWKEFSKAAALKSHLIKGTKHLINHILDNTTEGLKPKKEYCFLPIDTKYFGELRWEILASFDDIESKLNGVLIKSDNYQALNCLLPKYSGDVDLIYIDPPFNTGDDFDYKDKYRHSTWLSLMHNRMQLAHDLLSKKGSFYLHLDENADHYGRMLCDIVFGPENFRREIIWDIQVLSGFKVKGADKNWILGHQMIYFYTKSSDYNFTKLMQGHTQKYIDMFKGTDPDGRKFLVAHKTKRYLDKAVAKGKPFGDVWADLSDIVEDGQSFNEVWDMVKERIDNGREVSAVWRDIMSFQQQPTASERILFDTQKPEKLLERIIRSSTNSNSLSESLIIDYYGGSGTTAATCQKIGAKYISVEMGDHFYFHLIPRMKRTLIGHQTNVAKDNNYKGGGFFKYYELEQYEETLARAVYELKEKELGSYTFSTDQKLLEALEVDYQKEKAKLCFEKLYPDVDIAETISNITGKKIKNLSKEKVVFQDGSEVVFDEITFEKHRYLKPLIWWKSK